VDVESVSAGVLGNGFPLTRLAWYAPSSASFFARVRRLVRVVSRLLCSAHSIIARAITRALVSFGPRPRSGSFTWCQTAKSWTSCIANANRRRPSRSRYGQRDPSALAAGCLLGGAAGREAIRAERAQRPS
jgi:hypothetical protein